MIFVLSLILLSMQPLREADPLWLLLLVICYVFYCPILIVCLLSRWKSCWMIRLLLQSKESNPSVDGRRDHFSRDRKENELFWKLWNFISIFQANCVMFHSEEFYYSCLKWIIVILRNVYRICRTKDFVCSNEIII